MNYYLDLQKAKLVRKQVRARVKKFVFNEDIEIEKPFPVLEYFDRIFEENEKYKLIFTDNKKDLYIARSDITGIIRFYVYKKYYKLVEENFEYRRRIMNFVVSYYLLNDIHEFYIDQENEDNEFLKVYWNQVELYSEELLLPFSMYELTTDPMDICFKYKINMDLYLKLSKKKFGRKPSQKKE